MHVISTKDERICQSIAEIIEIIEHGSTLPQGDEIWIAPEYTIIPIEIAINCMEEFCDVIKRPECIRWEALWEEG